MLDGTEGMGKHNPKKRRANLRPVRNTLSTALGTLGTQTAISAGIVGASDVAYRLVSSDCTWSLANHTAGEGPIVAGYAFGDYTVGEIKEFIESQASISIGDKIAQERAGRWIRKVGTFSGLGTDETLNDGKPIKTRLNWGVPIGSTPNAFAYNDSSGNLAGGSLLKLNGTMWVKDNL